MGRPHYYELVDALAGMACQYLERDGGLLDGDAVSAGEIAIRTLTDLGLVRDGRLIPECFDFDWLRTHFPNETPNAKSEPTSGMAAKVGSTDGLESEEGK